MAAVPMIDIIPRSPSNSSGVQPATVAEAVGGCHLTPDVSKENIASEDDQSVDVAIAAKHSKWNKLRQTVKATTVFASTVSGTAAEAVPGPALTRGSRRKIESEAENRRDSFLKRFSTRQTSCGTSTSYLQTADGVSTPNSNLEQDEKVQQQNELCININYLQDCKIL